MSLHPWQAAAWAGIIELVESGRVPHALLLAGPPGSGKGDFAAALAARLLCTAPVAGLACGECRGCALLAAGTHPDFLRVAPEDDSSVIKVDQVRNAIRFTSLSTQQAGYKVLVIAPADSMNTAAANALLKTLEEPPAATVLVLVSSRLSALPATVLSRCRRISLAAASDAEGLAFLGEVAPDVARAALGLAGGAPLAARQLLELGLLDERGPMLAELDRLSADMTVFATVSKRWSGLGLASLALLLPSLLRDLLVVGAGGEDALLLHADLAPGLRALAKKVDLEPAARVPGMLLHLLAQKQAASGLREEMLVDELLGFWVEEVAAARGNG